MSIKVMGQRLSFRIGLIFIPARCIVMRITPMKAVSDRDVILPDGMEDAAYLKLLADVLEELAAEVKPDLVIYDAGIDVHKDDVLGRLAMTTEGVRAREEMVLAFWQKQAVPVATVIGGGYTKSFDEMIALHGLAFDVAAAMMRKRD